MYQDGKKLKIKTNLRKKKRINTTPTKSKSSSRMGLTQEQEKILKESRKINEEFKKLNLKNFEKNKELDRLLKKFSQLYEKLFSQLEMKKFRVSSEDILKRRKLGGLVNKISKLKEELGEEFEEKWKEKKVFKKKDIDPMDLDEEKINKGEQTSNLKNLKNSNDFIGNLSTGNRVLDSFRQSYPQRLCQNKKYFAQEKSMIPNEKLFDNKETFYEDFNMSDEEFRKLIQSSKVKKPTSKKKKPQRFRPSQIALYQTRGYKGRKKLTEIKKIPKPNLVVLRQAKNHKNKQNYEMGIGTRGFRGSLE